MVTVMILVVLASALLALFSGLFALRAGLRLRRTQMEVGGALFGEIERLSRRTTEVEANLRALDARAQALPIHIDGIQRNLATLRVLSNTLAVSLRQARKALSPAPLSQALKHLRTSTTKRPNEPSGGA